MLRSLSPSTFTELAQSDRLVHSPGNSPRTERAGEGQSSGGKPASKNRVERGRWDPTPKPSSVFDALRSPLGAGPTSLPPMAFHKARLPCGNRHRKRWGPACLPTRLRNRRLDHHIQPLLTARLPAQRGAPQRAVVHGCGAVVGDVVVGVGSYAMAAPPNMTHL
ncbi:MAG: hypothetical protein FE78DRAFT_409108 [Acidomyces sp. 'richmondensis']|nr:MAG: hypothetical protein FE78DRAFT_409108 [Acidomyces sp. 'richmondensis']